MGFSQTIKREALVLSARHCCVCHHYKGVKVEIHHIVPQTEGGSNDLENAISLCFDCHAEAGHYNPKHPRGTKFSRSELRKARDIWYELVANHKINVKKLEDVLYCRYVLSRHFNPIKEIADGNLSNLPFDKPFLVKNSVLHFFKKVTSGYPDYGRCDEYPAGKFETRENYASLYPNAQQLNNPRSYYPCFEYSRIPTPKEIEENLAGSDPISGMLNLSGVSANEISEAFL